jgi:hypothetical protein
MGMLLALALSASAHADATAPAPRSGKSAERTFTVDGVQFDLHAKPVRVGAAYTVSLSVDARSVDGKEHSLAFEPLTVSGIASCQNKDGTGQGSGFGDGGRAGSDGWSTGTRITPEKSAHLSRVLDAKYGIKRNCRLELNVEVLQFAHADGQLRDLDLGRVILSREHGSADEIWWEPPLKK